MPEVNFTSPPPPLVIGATGLEAVAQNIRVIVLTLAHSVALDRSFANTGGFIDAPTPYAVARKIAELTDAIETREPRAKVESIRFAARSTAGQDAMEGRVHPIITFSIRKGVTL